MARRRLIGSAPHTPPRASGRTRYGSRGGAQRREREPSDPARSSGGTVRTRDCGRAGRPGRWRPPPRDGRGDRPSQIVTGAGTRLGEPFGVLLLSFADGLVHGPFEVIAEILAELLSHLLHEPAHARRIVLVQIAEVGGIAEGVQALVFRLDAREARHEAGQGCAPAPGTGRRGSRGGPQDEQAHPAPAVAALVLVN